MYNESRDVLRVLAPLFERVTAGFADNGVHPVNDLSIETMTSFLTSILVMLKAGPVWEKDVDKVRAALQCGYMLKKFRFGGNPTERANAAVKGFIARNDDLRFRSSSQYYSVPKVEGHVHHGNYHELPQVEPSWFLQGMRRELARALPQLKDSGFNPKFGMGAVAEHVPWLARWERIAAYPCMHHEHNLIVSMGLTLHGGESVRLCAVPKDYIKDRLITVEPWLNTWIQHAARRMLYESVHRGPLRGTAMDALYVQPELLQRSYAVEGSKNGRFASLDLSDASDSIPLAYVEAVFPEWCLAWILPCRTPRFETRDGQVRELFMFAGMGNATTFVVETLYFWAACVTAAKMCGHRTPFVSVHGDDIICDDETVSAIFETGCFRALGLKINEAKSYWGQCSFRESCGVWALRGHIVTPSRFDGFDLGSFPGRVGFSDVIRRMLDSGCGMQLLLADRLVKSAVGIKVNPWNVLGTERVFDKHKLWTNIADKPVIRYNNFLCRFEQKAETLQPELLRIPTDRIGYLYGALLGGLTTDDRSVVLGDIRCPKDDDPVRRSTDHSILIPLPHGRVKTKKRWLPLEGDVPMGARSSFKGR